MFLTIASTGEPLDCVDLVVVVARSLTPEMVIVVTAPIPPFSVVMIIIAPRVAVVEMSAVVSGIISLRRLLALLGSSDVFSDKLFCVIGVGIIFCYSEELSDHAQPLA
jgi:hypothetical protein